MAIGFYGFQSPLSLPAEQSGQSANAGQPVPSAPAPVPLNPVMLDAQLSLSLQARTLSSAPAPAPQTAPALPVGQPMNAGFGGGPVSSEGTDYLQRRRTGFR